MTRYFRKCDVTAENLPLFQNIKGIQSVDLGSKVIAALDVDLLSCLRVIILLLLKV